MTAGLRLHKGCPSPGWWHSFIFLFLSLSGRVISFCDLRNTDSTTEYHPNEIIIPDDEKAPGLEQGRSRPQRASWPDYSYRGWEDTMDDASDGVTTSPARKCKRNTTDGESIMLILVWTSDMVFFLG